MIDTIKDRIKKQDRMMNFYYSIRFVFFGNKKRIAGDNNRIIYQNALLKKVTFDIKGENNTIEFGESASIIECNVQIRGNNHVLKIGDRTVFYKCWFKFEDHNCSIVVGDETKMYEYGEISAVEPYSAVEIGKNCLFSTNIDIRNTDSHSILDAETGKRINPGKNVFIGDRVWIGAYAGILKGVTIGNNSIIGIKSLVTKDVPSHSIVAGVPARVIKTNIDWCAERI